MDVYPVDWQADDVDGQYTITLFGRTPSSKVVAVHIKYFPFFFVGMPPGCPHMKTQEFVKEAVKKHGALQEYSGHTERVSMWGFTNSTKVPMAVLGFPTLKKMRIAAAAMRGKGLVTYESSIDPLLRFFHVRDISPSQWVTVAAATHAPTPSTRAAIELNTVFNRVGPSTLTQRPPLTICSWDLETYSLSRKFPQAHNASDAIIQIACSFQRYGEPEPYRRLVMCLKETAPVEGVEIRWFDDEATMINAWMHELAVEQPDLMVGYNTNGFDWPYLYGRYLVLVEDSTGTPHVILGLLGRMQQGGGELQQHTFSSNAHGENTSTTLAIPGMLNLDLMQLMRREFQLADYSLDAVAKKYLGDSKIDLAAGEIFDKYEGSPTDRALVAEYAIKDTLLPLRLLDKLCILSNLTEMAGAAFVPVSFVLTKGQQIKVYSLMMKNARQLGFACPDKKGIGVKGKYTGATVLSAMKGFHTDIVSCLDFASLYPSIIRAWNLDYSTIVIEPRFDDLSGIEYFTVETDQGTFRFAQGVPSVLPRMLADLAKLRKAAKAEMAAAEAREDFFMGELYNAKQKAIKVLMNSVYGAVGASNGMLPCVPIAASVTSTGRSMIQKTRALVQQKFPGSTVVYGDSVSGSTPVIIQTDLGVKITAIEKLGVDWQQCLESNKEFAELEGVHAWTEEGWTPVHRVIRHKVDKPLVRVWTPRGEVCVTPDHSLLTAKGEPIKPDDITPETPLLHFASYPQAWTLEGVVTSTADAALMGNAAREGPCEPVPMSILAASKEVREMYWRGFLNLQPWKGFAVIRRATPVAAATMMMLIESLGMHAAIGESTHLGHKVYACVDPIQYPAPSCKVIPFPNANTQSYVYDLTTTNHHFAAGIGTLVVHNTDSIMCILNLGDDKRGNLTAHLAAAAQLADDISKEFPYPIKIEFEKLYMPMLLIAKKMYAGLMWVNDKQSLKVDIKGLSLVRRDSCNLVWELSTAILNALMYELSAEKAIEEARQYIMRVLQDKEPLEKFVLSKKLRTTYVNTAQPHLVVARKMRERTGEMVPSGARVQFVYVLNFENPTGMLAEYAEDPEYVKAHGLPLHKLFYIERQLTSPIKTLLSVLVPDPFKAVFEHVSVKPFMDQALREKLAAENKANKQTEITRFFHSKPV